MEDRDDPNRELGARIDAPGLGELPLLLCFSAALAHSDVSLIEKAISRAKSGGITRIKLYELALQSHLFLGFPAMLVALETLFYHWPSKMKYQLEPVTSKEGEEWLKNGTNLCRHIYGENYDRLVDLVGNLSPEVLRWMVSDGYGKVLSREGLDVKCRELAIIVFLIIDNRPRQLFSHIRGALNVGATVEEVELAVETCGTSAAGYEDAHRFLKQLRPV